MLCAVLSHSVMSDSLQPHRQAPLSRDFPGKNTGVGCHNPPPGDLPKPGIKPRSPALQMVCLPSEPSGKPHEYRTGNSTQNSVITYIRKESEKE